MEDDGEGGREGGSGSVRKRKKWMEWRKGGNQLEGKQDLAGV